MATLDYPIKLIKDNFIMTKENQLWAYYKVPDEVIAKMDSVSKEKFKRKLTFWLDDLVSYEDLDVRMIPRDMTLEERFNDYVSQALPHNKKVARYYMERLLSQIEREMGNAYVYDWVVGVRLYVQQDLKEFKNIVKEQTRKFIDEIASFFGYEVDLPKNFFSTVEPLEEKIFAKISSLNGTRISEVEMLYLNRYNFIRNMKHSLINESLNNNLEDVIDGIIDPTKQLGTLRLESYEGESYVSFLPLAETKLNLGFNHLAEHIQTLPFPVELHFKCHFASKGELDGVLNVQETRLGSITDDMLTKGADLSEKIYENKVLLNDCRNKIDKQNNILEWVAVAVVYGKTKEECLRRVDSLKSAMKSLDLDFVRATADQLYLFDLCLMGQTIPVEKFWKQYTTTETFAETLIMTSQRLGTRIGDYIGRVSSRFELQKSREQAIADSKNLVLLSLLLANKDVDGKRTSSPHVAITGETGTGKSFFMKLLFFYVSMYAKTLYFDPKGEMRSWFMKVLNDEKMQQKYPEMIEYVGSFSYLTLDHTNSENWGVLDPIVFLNEHEAKTVASSMFEQLYDWKDKEDVQLAILQSIDSTLEEKVDGKNVGMRTVVKKLLNHSDINIRNVGELMERMIKNTVLELAFSDGNSKTLDLNQSTTIIEIQGLKLPDKRLSRKDYREDDKRAVCLMISFGKFMDLFGTRDKEEETVIFADESWVISQSAEGSKILNEMKRKGRSFNNVLVYGTQSVDDTKDELGEGNFGSLFAFDNPQERQKILEFLNIPVNDKTINWLANTIGGQCLMTDIYRHVGKITIHCPFPEVRELLKTVEQTETANLENKYI